MKKTMVRVVAALLVAMLALTLIPVGAFADETIQFWQFYTDDSTPKYEDNYLNALNGTYFDNSRIKVGASGITIKTSDYDKYYVAGDGKIYDIDQFYLQSYDPNTEIFSTAGVGTSLTISGVPTNSEELNDWRNKYCFIDLGYVAHNHALSNWYSDGTTHWRECLACKKYLGHFNQFMYQNWCQDGDEDGICNVCGGDVPYHDITVIEEEGGKITVNRDNASHRMKITADVEPAEGYKLKKLHFTKIRDDGSEQEITRYKKNGQFWTYMPTYELEVSAEFVKTKK